MRELLVVTSNTIGAIGQFDGLLVHGLFDLDVNSSLEKWVAVVGGHKLSFT